MLMPASNDAKKDREIFLKVLTMDDKGAWERCKDFLSSVLWRTMDGPSRSMFDALQVALNDEVAVNQLIDRTTATRNPFDAMHSKVEDADWETCATVLNGLSMREMLAKGW